MTDGLDPRRSPVDLSAEQFREIGHALVDGLADFWDTVDERPVTPGDDPAQAWSLIGKRRLPDEGEDAGEVMRSSFEAMAAGSLLNGHPRFMGYITSSAAPLGVLSDLLAASINPNCGGWPLSPVAGAIEIQTVQWIGELLGYRSPCSGLMCSGGNVANMIGFWVARTAVLGQESRSKGVSPGLCAYAPAATHTWLEKASDLSGVGRDAVRMLPGKDELMSPTDLEQAVLRDKDNGLKPFLVVASGGTVSTGQVDDIGGIADVCEKHGLWLHVDGAYGAPAACLPEAPAGLKALARADSIAVDPHKWLYSPLEAGCVLTRDRQCLLDAFSYRPPYYHFGREDSEDWISFFEVGIQNSRAFRALKVWTVLRQLGRKGYVETIGQDVALARALAGFVEDEPELELKSCRLSIACFRYVPPGVTDTEYLNRLNEAILSAVCNSGRAFVSNAVIDGEYLLRACIVNFRTGFSDVQELASLCASEGRRLDSEMRSKV